MEFKLLASEPVYSGFLKISKNHLQHESYHGGWCREIVRERIERLSAVSVLLYDPERDKVVMVEQFRIGALEAPSGAWLLETVGGYRPPDEDPEAVARWEAHEEAGCEIQALEHIGTFFVSPGTSSEEIALYCGMVDSRQADGIHGLEEEGEETRVLVMSLGEAVDALFGRINSTSSIIAVQWLMQNHERLKKEWKNRLNPEPSP